MEGKTGCEFALCRISGDRLKYIIITVLIYLGHGRTSGVWPSKSNRLVELQHRTNPKSAGQLHNQARKSPGGTSPVPSTARTRRVLQEKRDCCDRVLVFRRERRSRIDGNELGVMNINMTLNRESSWNNIKSNVIRTRVFTVKNCRK